MAGKLTKRQLTAPDRLMQTTGGWFEWAKNHPKETLIGAGGLVVAVVIIGVLLTPSQIAVEPKAGQALSEALALLDARIDPEATPEGEERVFASEAARQQALIEALQQVRSAHPKSSSALTATLSLGDAHGRLGQTEEALRAYDEVIAKAPKGGGLRTLALEGRAHALAAGGKAEDAVAAWDRLAAEAPAFKAQALLRKGRLLEKQEKKDAAIAAYEQLSTEFGSTAAGSEGGKRLVKLRGGAQQPMQIELGGE